MDAATVVKLVILGFEVMCALILANLMCQVSGHRTPVQAALEGAEILAFMVLAMLPAPRRARHRVRGREASA